MLVTSVGSVALIAATSVLPAVLLKAVVLSVQPVPSATRLKQDQSASVAQESLSVPQVVLATFLIQQRHGSQTNQVVSAVVKTIVAGYLSGLLVALLRLLNQMIHQSDQHLVVPALLHLRLVLLAHGNLAVHEKKETLQSVHRLTVGPQDQLTM
jgi:hypothetical protein